MNVVPVRVTTAFKHLLRLPGVNVRGVLLADPAAAADLAGGIAATLN